MRNFVKKAGAALGVGFVSIASGVAFAQVVPSTPPTTAVALAQGISMSDAQSAGLIIVSLLIGVGVVLWGARLVLSKFHPKI